MANPTFHVREQNPSSCWGFAHRSSLHSRFRDAIREDSRQTTPSRGVTQRKKFAVEANVESRVKAMVEGMKNEARRYLAAGGSIVEYGKRLTERQDAEIAIYNRVKADIDKARATLSESEFMTYWEKRNDELRNLGIKTIGLSDE